MSRMKKVALYGSIVVILLALLGAWAQYTHTGRVYAMYVFAGIKAPLTVKYSCVQDTNARVDEKFLEPIPLDQASINGLREFWHFSYYRQCLFMRGYDFYGTKIAPTELSKASDGYTYRNDFANIAFRLPSPSELVTDNATDPDYDDYMIWTELTVQGKPVSVHMDRSFKVANDEELAKVFAGFDEKQGYTSPTLVRESSPFPGVLKYRDGDKVGYVINHANHHIVMLFGSRDAEAILEDIARTIEWL